MSFYHHYYKKSLNEKLVAVESRNGTDLAGNILRIMEELSKPEYGNFKFIVSITDEKRKYAEKLLARYNIKNVRLVRFDSWKSLNMTARAKYILNDSAYVRRYVKKQGQIYLNTWHGTPLKHMGRDNANEVYSMGNVVRNLLQSDYILFPNKYMMDIMSKSYSLNNLYQGIYLLEGYPRNTAFFKPGREQIRSELGVAQKQVIVYMPTWRGTLANRLLEEQVTALRQYFDRLDSLLTDSQLMYIKLHPLMRSANNFSGYKHIAEYPDTHETYDILNAADILVTDYSSVFYDFACTGRKIILFAYDKEEYLRERGIYLKLEDLPFPMTNTVEDLVYEINTPKNYDDKLFLEIYCPYESAESTARICRHVFLGEKICREEKAVSNGKNNILLFGGNLSKNGLTSAFLNMLQNIDSEEFNYVVSFRQSSLYRNPERTRLLPDNVQLVPISSNISSTVSERWLNYRYSKTGKLTKRFQKLQKRLYEREIARHFGGIQFSDVIQFCGYEQYIIEMFQYFSCNKVIYVHSNMVAEINKRSSQKQPVLKLAYNTYNKVALVNEDLIKPTYEISGRKDNFVIINNFQDPKGVIKKSVQPIEFENDTDCITFDPHGIEGVLSSSGIKFITIGRFSPEKDHKRLIDAFEQFQAEHNDAKLIIIGGHGPLYSNTVRLMRTSSAWKNITIIRSILNPMSILKRCDAFVLSSHYEGMPVVLFEAAILDIPSFAPNVNGIRGFMEKFGGYMCDDSTEGILKGMNDFAAGKIMPVTIDIDNYNNDVLSSYHSVLSNSPQNTENFQ